MPKVSVVMSVYNGLPHLHEAVKSILRQTLREFEFIIIDDGSVDGSTEVLSDYARRNRRITLIRQENRGLTPSLNTGISAAEGEYIARMDADDISLPDRLERQVDHMERRVNCVAVGGQVILIDADGRRVRASTRPPAGEQTGRVRALWTEHASIEKALLDGDWPLVHPASMLRRRAVLEVGGYDERFPRVQDHDLFLKLAERGRLANLPSLVLYYRHHEDQTTNQVTDQNYLLRVIRRNAHIRRNRVLPADLGLPAVVRSWIGKELRRTPVWPTALEFYNRIRR